MKLLRQQLFGQPRDIGRLAALCVAAATFAGVPTPAAASPVTRPSCASPGAGDCSLAWAARQSGIYVGTAISNSMTPLEQADTLAHFTAFTTENAFKWSETEPTKGSFNWGVTDALVDFAQSHGLRLRAHNIFWHRMQTPAWVKAEVDAAADPKAKLKQLMTDRINSVMGRYRGRVAVWDVVNEPLALFGSGWDTADSLLTPANFFYTTAGEGYLDDAFNAARAADPKAKLFLNETVWNPAIGDPKADFLLALVQRLRQRKVPIDGVGLQMHAMFGAKEPMFSGSTSKLAAYMNALARTGVKVEITELDVSLPQTLAAFGRKWSNTTDAQALAMQASVFQRTVRACAQVAACTGVTVWGMRDNNTWLDRFGPTAGLAPHRPLLLDGTGARKPAYNSVRDALLERCPLRGRQKTPCSTPWPAAS